MTLILKMAVRVGWAIAVLIAANASAADAPRPLLKSDSPVKWWFVFKLNSGTFPGCDGGPRRVCPFGGTLQKYKTASGQQFVYASSANRTLKQSSSCAGGGVNDPLGATFSEVYNGNFNYIVWNDQFYDSPKIPGCSKSCGAPWGHSKGLLAWNDDGDGLVLQVTTPSWPGSGNKANPRKKDGNTLGCVKNNNTMVSQDFFALSLTKGDVKKVLEALSVASVVIDMTSPQLVHDGRPAEFSGLLNDLGKKSSADTYYSDKLSSGIRIIAKPSKLNAPPWQLVSGILGGPSLRVASWWMKPAIHSTVAGKELSCWPDTLSNDPKIKDPGDVEIATTGQWDGTIFGLEGGASPNKNHAKIGVSTSGSHPYVIFGDMNQQGTAIGDRSCSSSQNGRGGIFYVLEDKELNEQVASLIAGESAPQGRDTDRK